MSYVLGKKQHAFGEETTHNPPAPEASDRGCLLGPNPPGSICLLPAAQLPLAYSCSSIRVVHWPAASMHGRAQCRAAWAMAMAVGRPPAGGRCRRARARGEQIAFRICHAFVHGRNESRAGGLWDLCPFALGHGQAMSCVASTVRLVCKFLYSCIRHCVKNPSIVSLSRRHAIV